MSDYVILFGYFTDWLNENYADVSLIAEIDTNILREYAVYLSEKKFNSKTGSYGL
jgi:integrase/recombinase XerD